MHKCTFTGAKLLQTWPQSLDLKFINRKSYTKFHLNMSKNMGQKCWKLCISNILISGRSKTTRIDANWRRSNLIWSPSNFILKRKSYTKFQVNMSKHVGEKCRNLSSIITPPTSFSQSRHSIDVTWRHTLSPRCTQRQKSVTGIHWNAYYRLNKGWWHDKFVIRSVSDVLRTRSRLVKRVGGSACGLTPHKFY